MRRRICHGLLAIVFIAALVIGSGPGIWLVNTPDMVPLIGDLALPKLYVWGLFWYFIEVMCVLIAYLFVWRTPAERAEDTPARNGET